MVAKPIDTDLPSTSQLNNIEITNVNKNNLTKFWPEILVNLSQCSYVAIDLELSGLGDLHRMRNRNVSERFVVQREAALTRSVLSFGIAFFKFDSKNDSRRSLCFSCKVYNILTLCSQPFTIEPDALKFLAKHSFDFNRLIALGVPYSVSSVKGACPMRSLIIEIFSSGKPLLFHNGLTDVIFLYHHFYSPLPSTWAEFSNALADIFTTESPLCDSKYLTEYEFRTKATFLEYIFRKSQRENLQEAKEGRYHISIGFPTNSASMDTEKVNCELPDNFPNHVIPSNIDVLVCEDFANHGFCRKYTKGECCKSHDVDHVLDLDLKRKEKEKMKKKRKYNHLKPESIIQKEIEEQQAKAPVLLDAVDISKTPKISVIGCHRAGVDAFMTGFSILFSERVHLWRTGHIDESHLNKIPLSGKAQPFVIQSTHSAGDCPLHMERFTAIRSRRTH